jgi:hypothetical protein
MECGVTPDAVLTEAERAMSALGELSGRTAPGRYRKPYLRALLRGKLNEKRERYVPFCKYLLEK